MEKNNTESQLLRLNIEMDAHPVIQINTESQSSNNLTGSALDHAGITVLIDVITDYESLSRVLNHNLQGMIIKYQKGFIKIQNHINQTSIWGVDNGMLQGRIEFSGTNNGTVYFTGKPVYNINKRSIEIENLQYQLKTQNWLLKIAQVLFTKKIEDEFKKYTSFNLSENINQVTRLLNSVLTKEWQEGISSTGTVSEVNVKSVQALPQHLLVQCYFAGSLTLSINRSTL